MEAKLSALYELAHRLILPHDPQPIVEAVSDVAVRVLNLQGSDFLPVDEGRRELCVAAERSRKGGHREASVAGRECGDPGGLCRLDDTQVVR